MKKIVAVKLEDDNGVELKENDSIEVITKNCSKEKYIGIFKEAGIKYITVSTDNGSVIILYKNIISILKIND